MTTTYDPAHPAYYDVADLRGELERVYDLCHGCRMCFNLCPSFPALFDFVDAHDGRVDAMTEPEQDRVVELCYQCKLCYVKCPYIPPHEWALDFPRLMMRAHAAKVKSGSGTLRDKMSNQVLGRTDLIGKVSTAAAGLANATTGRPGSLARRAMEKVTGIAAERLLPPYARERFSTWFRRRRGVAPFIARRQATVALFPSCFVEYMDPGVGKALVGVYERNGVEVGLPDGIACCGAPWLHAGEVDAFVDQARRNVEVLASEVRAGRDVVVPQPTCGYVLKKDYPQYLANADAELVGEHTFDACEYLMRLHRADDTSLDTEFAGSVPAATTYHPPCHLQAQNVGMKSRDLMKLTGTRITLANKCSGIDGTWGYRAENYELSRQVAAELKEAVDKAGNDVVTGDCHLANHAILQETGIRPLHPLQFVARAYGIDDGTAGP